ncbi:putative viral DNA helicase and primase [Microplitis demolitor]|uniref:putative viral DNA helicase and primase n=1 Tax=Microplitis demolitor TaxID=69319 RepID=UPI00044001E9|nr:putative viral DNA helicase and primase [Microplitis demolitor]KAG6558354.1 putative viral DNA helicase and primase [Microplitis demolitor]
MDFTNASIGEKRNNDSINVTEKCNFKRQCYDPIAIEKSHHQLYPSVNNTPLPIEEAQDVGNDDYSREKGAFQASEKNILQHYNTANNANVASQMTSFYNKFESYHITNINKYQGSKIVLYDALNKKNLYFDSNVPFSLENFQDLFHLSGHALYLDLTRNYVTMLTLVLECLPCKTNTCASKMTSSQYASYLDDILLNLWKEINSHLDLSSINLQENVVACFRDNGCSVHIYINVSVSINVYEHIINVLNKSKSDYMKPILKRYEISHVSRVPLPYSTDHDGHIYNLSLQGNHELYNIDIIPSAVDYIDFEMQLTNDFNIGKDIILAKIVFNHHGGLTQQLYHDEISQEWDITDNMEMEVVYVIAILKDCEPSVDSDDGIPKLCPVFNTAACEIPAFIRSHRNFILESNNRNFQQFVQNLLQENYNKCYRNANSHQHPLYHVHVDATELERHILLTLDSIGRNIARHVYQIETPITDTFSSNEQTKISPGNSVNFRGVHRYLSYLVQFCHEPDNSAGYAFYVLVLSVMYTTQKLMINAENQQVIFAMIRRAITLYDSYDNRQLLWILDSLIKIDCMAELGRIFPEPLRILKQLATSVFMRRRVESRLVNDALISAPSDISRERIKNPNKTSSLVSSTSISYDVLLFDELCRLYLHDELPLYKHLTDLMLEEIVTTIFRRYLILFYRNVMNNNVMYIYKDPLYIEYKMSNFVSDTTANSKLRFMYDKLQMYIIPIFANKNSSITESKCRNLAMKIIKNAWYNYVNEHIPVKNVHFGKYRYFVCTLRGVFNNITGLYMSGIPQLYFENASSFCILPPIGISDTHNNRYDNYSQNTANYEKTNFDKTAGNNNEHSDSSNENIDSNNSSLNIMATVNNVNGHNYQTQLRIINDELIIRIDNWKKLIHVYLTSQDQLFYLSVMVPGLLKIGESVFDKQTRLLAINTITDRILKDRSSKNEDELFYLLPVMQYHCIDCNSIMAIARCIDSLINEKNFVVTTSSLSNVFNNLYKSDLNNLYKAIGGKRDSQFDYEIYTNPNDLFDNIINGFTYHPHKRLFSVAFVWSLMEYYNSDEDIIRVKFDITRRSRNIQLMRESIMSSKEKKLSVTLQGDPFGLTKQKFDLSQFTCETNENFRRAFNITFQRLPSNDDSEKADSEKRATGSNSHVKRNKKSTINEPVQLLDICMYNALLSISIIFRFDTKTITDYLEHCALLFQPFNNCRKFTLYYGEPRCGKSFLANLIIRAAEPSVFNVLSDLATAATAASPSPDLIKAFQSYVVCIKEVRRLEESLLKTITGEDHMDQRDLYKGYQKLTPICFIFGCSNQIPQIEADEAIKDRLSIFNFTNRIEPCYNFREVIDDNQLLLYINECTIQPSIEELATSIGLYNSIYATFCLTRNKFGLVIPTIKNHSSLQIMKKFLIHNSLMYYIMDLCGIEVVTGYSIKMDDLKYRVERAIEKSKRATRNNYQLNDFISDFSQHFRKLCNRNDYSNNDVSIEYIGVGLPPTNASHVNLIESVFGKICGNISELLSENEHCSISIPQMRDLIIREVSKATNAITDRKMEYATRILLKIKNAYYKFYNTNEQRFDRLQIITSE